MRRRSSGSIAARASHKRDGWPGVTGHSSLRGAVGTAHAQPLFTAPTAFRVIKKETQAAGWPALRSFLRASG